MDRKGKVPRAELLTEITKLREEIVGEFAFVLFCVLVTAYEYSPLLLFYNLMYYVIDTYFGVLGGDIDQIKFFKKSHMSYKLCPAP